MEKLKGRAKKAFALSPDGINSRQIRVGEEFELVDQAQADSFVAAGLIEAPVKVKAAKGAPKAAEEDVVPGSAEDLDTPLPLVPPGTVYRTRMPSASDRTVGQAPTPATLPQLREALAAADAADKAAAEDKADEADEDKADEADEHKG